MSARVNGGRTRRCLAASVVLGLAGSLLVAGPPTSAQPEVRRTRVVRPEADSYGSAQRPGLAPGSAPRLLVDGSPRRHAYLRFAVPEFRARVLSATLRLHVADVAGAGGPNGGQVAASSDLAWPEATTTWTTRPIVDGTISRAIGPAVRNSWVDVDVTPLVRSGDPLTLVIRPVGQDDVAYDARGSGRAARLQLDLDASPLAGVVVAAVGDMVCGPGAATTATQCHELEVSDQVENDSRVEAFLALGDLQYNSGSLADFQSEYEPTYGRFKDITRPVVGNHKYQTAGAAGYWDYFGAAAGTEGEGWYSFDLGTTWHVVALNSNCTEVSCAPGSPQLDWLRADLAANDRPCVLAAFHHPRWSSGITPGDNPSVSAFVRVLQRERAELMLSGHAHNYERFAPQRPDETASADGIRQFVVGTGGRDVGPTHGFNAQPRAHSRVRIAHVFGVMKLTLTDGAYWWSFEAENGRVLDSGTDRCR